MNNYRGRILNNNHRDNNRLEMLDEDVITIAPSVVVPSVTGNLYLGSIFERIFQV